MFCGDRGRTERGAQGNPVYCSQITRALVGLLALQPNALVARLVRELDHLNESKKKTSATLQRIKQTLLPFTVTPQVSRTSDLTIVTFEPFLYINRDLNLIWYRRRRHYLRAGAPAATTVPQMRI